MDPVEEKTLNAIIEALGGRIPQGKERLEAVHTELREMHLPLSFSPGALTALETYTGLKLRGEPLL